MSKLDGKIPGDRTMRLGRTQMPRETNNAAGDGEGQGRSPVRGAADALVRSTTTPTDEEVRPSTILLQPSLSFFRRARAISGNFGRIAEYFNHNL